MKVDDSCALAEVPNEKNGDLGMDTTDTDCVQQTYDQVRDVGDPVDDGRCDEDGGQPVEPDNTVGVDIVDQAAQFGPHGTDRPRRSKNPNARYNADDMTWCLLQEWCRVYGCLGCLLRSSASDEFLSRTRYKRLLNYGG